MLQVRLQHLLGRVREVSEIISLDVERRRQIDNVANGPNPYLTGNEAALQLFAPLEPFQLHNPNGSPYTHVTHAGQVSTRGKPLLERTLDRSRLPEPVLVPKKIERGIRGSTGKRIPHVRRTV